MQQRGGQQARQGVSRVHQAKPGYLCHQQPQLRMSMGQPQSGLLQSARKTLAPDNLGKLLQHLLQLSAVALKTPAWQHKYRKLLNRHVLVVTAFLLYSIAASPVTAVSWHLVSQWATQYNQGRCCLYCCCYVWLLPPPGLTIMSAVS